MLGSRRYVSLTDGQRDSCQPSSPLQRAVDIRNHNYCPVFIHGEHGMNCSLASSSSVTFAAYEPKVGKTKEACTCGIHASSRLTFTPIRGIKFKHFSPAGRRHKGRLALPALTA